MNHFHILHPPSEKKKKKKKRASQSWNLDFLNKPNCDINILIVSSYFPYQKEQ